MSAPGTPELSVAVRTGLWMALAAVLFALMLASIRVLRADLASAEVVFLRNLVGAIVMLPWLVSRGWHGLASRRMDLHIVRAVLSFVSMFMVIYALGVLPLADVTALQFTLPLFTTVLAALLLGERPGRRRIAALLLGFVGVLIIIRPGFASVGVPTLLVLLASFLAGGANIATKAAARVDSAALIVFYMNSLMLPVSAAIAVFDWTWPSLSDLPWILILGVTGAGAHVCLTRAVAIADASLAMTFDFLRLPCVAVLAFVLFGEWPTLWTWLGGAVIFVSSIYIARREARTGRAVTSPGVGT